MEGYKCVKEIGRGGFGVVYSATAPDGKEVAVKVIHQKKIEKWHTYKNGKRVPRELAVWRHVGHIKGVIRLIEYHKIDKYHYFVMEKPEGAVDLFELLDKKGPLPEEDARFVFSQVLNVLNKMHQIGVVHRDIKDENLLVHPDTLQVWLLDFGLAKFHCSGQTSSRFRGTASCMSPEFLVRGVYCPRQAEVWALGIMLYCTLTGRDPFETREDLIQAALAPPKDISEDCLNFMKATLCRDPKKRATLGILLDMPWILKNNK